MEQFQVSWYAWGALLSFTIALLTMFGVFSDAQRKQVEATLWKTLTVLTVVLLLPSVLLVVFSALQKPLSPALFPLAGIGVLAVAVSLVCLPLYGLGVGVSTVQRCPNCGKPRDPSWPFCPACQYDKPSAPTSVPMSAYIPPEPSAPFAASLPQPTQPIYVSPTMPIDVQPPPTTPIVLANGEGQTPEPGATRLIKTVPTALAYWAIGEGVHQGRTFQLGETTNVGRKAEVNDIVVEDDSASRQHARVRLESGKFVLYDLASGNGTFVRTRPDGEWERIQKRTLADGMNVKIGETVFVFIQVQSGKEE